MVLLRPLRLLQRLGEPLSILLHKHTFCTKTDRGSSSLCSSLRGLNSTIQLRIDSYQPVHACPWKFHNPVNARGHVPPPHPNPSAVTCAKSKASRLFGVDIITELRGWSSDSGLRFQFIAVPANTSLHHIFPKFSNLLAYFRCKIQVFWEGHKTFVKLLLFYFTLHTL